MDFAGGRACPPEDVGGTYGYAEMLRVLSPEPDSNEAKRYRTWAGDDFDAELFDRPTGGQLDAAAHGVEPLGQRVDRLEPLFSDASGDPVCFN